MKFSIKDFFSWCNQIRRKLRIWSHLLKRSLTENFTLCAVDGNDNNNTNDNNSDESQPLGAGKKRDTKYID